MADDDGGEAIAGCIGVFLVGLLIVMAVAAAIAAFASIGAVYGAGLSLRNYIRAFIDNVKPEQVTP
jgi:hypothetical protein